LRTNNIPIALATEIGANTQKTTLSSGISAPPG